MTMMITRESGKELALEVAVFAAGAGEIALLYGRPWMLTALLVATAVPVVAFHARRGHLAVCYAIGAAIGPLGEVIGVGSGAWRYAEATYLGIPLWLPFAWGLITVVIIGISETVAEIPRRQQEGPSVEELTR